LSSPFPHCPGIHGWLGTEILFRSAPLTFPFTIFKRECAEKELLLEVIDHSTPLETTRQRGKGTSSASREESWARECRNGLSDVCGKV
jgi:hypothetical protein